MRAPSKTIAAEATRYTTATTVSRDTRADERAAPTSQIQTRLVASAEATGGIARPWWISRKNDSTTPSPAAVLKVAVTKTALRKTANTPSAARPAPARTAHAIG